MNSVNNMAETAAASKIQTWWRNRATPASLYFKIKTIKNASSEELASGKMDTLIEGCLGRKETIMLLANALFGGREQRYGEHSKRTCLAYLLYDRESSVKDIAVLIKDLLEIDKRVWKGMAELEKERKTELSEEKRVLDSAGEISWAAKVGKGENEIVHISHGGGLVYIRLFLTGQDEGYTGKGEFLGKGIFVTPGQDKEFQAKKNTFYATRHVDNWDIPAYFEADIPAGKLGAVPNGYEAVLRRDNIKHLRNISITICPLSSKEIFYRGLPPYPAQTEAQELSIEQGLMERIDQSFLRINNLDIK